MMTTVYTLTSNGSSRKAIAFFKHHKLPHREVKLLTELTVEDLKKIASRVESIDELISTRSQQYKQYKELIEKEDTKLSDVFQYIMENPRVLRAPIVMNERHFYIGYTDDEMGTFLPRSMKKQTFHAYLEIARRYDKVPFVDELEKKSFAEEMEEVRYVK